MNRWILNKIWKWIIWNPISLRRKSSLIEFSARLLFNLKMSVRKTDTEKKFLPSSRFFLPHEAKVGSTLICLVGNSFSNCSYTEQALAWQVLRERLLGLTFLPAAIRKIRTWDSWMWSANVPCRSPSTLIVEKSTMYWVRLGGPGCLHVMANTWVRIQISMCW